MIKQEGMILSPYIDLYDIIIPEDHELRQLNELVDFSFVDDLLKHTVERHIKYTKKIKLNARRHNVKFRSIQII